MTGQGSIEQFNLRSRLRFNIEKGQIWLDENRMLLLHARAMGALRKELIDTLGQRRAQGLLLRMGFVSGQQDADLAAKLQGVGDNYDVFRIGPELHAFEGLVKAEITKAEIDWEAGSFFGEVEWEDSWEAESHIQQFGVGHDPACWTLAGYASGYVTRFFNRLVIFREISCRCKGDPKCFVIGKPVEAWGEDPYLLHFSPESLDWELQEMEAELVELRGQLRETHEHGKLVGSSPGFRNAFELLAKAAKSPINVLLLGETGVGKEVFARWLHENSGRNDKPFIAVNCAAIPHDLIESELFGVQKGAYTGAQESRPGRFERADGGTLFLDELGELSLSAQVKLLRVLQTGEVERLGDGKTRKVDVRLVAATNVDLLQAIGDGKFRSDLYYRLATYPVTIPPLRERKTDIPLLVAAMLDKYVPRYHKVLDGLTDRALQMLMDHHWPGNIRELENLIERGVLLAPSGGKIEVEHMFADARLDQDCAKIDRRGELGDSGHADRSSLCESLLESAGFDLRSHEAMLLNLAVQQAGGNLTHAARALGITRRQLAYRIKQLDQGEPETD